MNRIVWTCALAFLPALAQAGEWQPYESHQLGFRMKVPAGMKLKSELNAKGWGLLHGELGGVHLYAVGYSGKQQKENSIKAYGVEHTGFPEHRWTEFDDGASKGNWAWFKAVEGEHEGTVLYGIYGTGPRGACLVALKTSAEDFKQNRALYQAWYDSVELDDRWSIHRSDDFGFRMLIAKDAEVDSAEAVNEWTALFSDHDDGSLFAAAKLGTEATLDELQTLGVDLTEIDRDTWKVVEEGKDVRGWSWFKRVHIESGDDVHVGGYGVNDDGSYLFLLSTTKNDYTHYKDLYDRWFSSVHLDD